MSHSAKTCVWLVRHFTLWRHVLRRYQRWASCCRSNRGTATSIWHLGKHSQCGEQNGQHWSARKDSGIKDYFPKYELTDLVVMEICLISKTLKNRQPDMPPVTSSHSHWLDQQWFAFAIVSQSDLSHLRTSWCFIFEMSCDDLIFAQP